MSIVGCVLVKGDWFFIIENSWGMTYHRGFPWFPIPFDLMESWLRSADCASVGEIDLSDNPPVWPEGAL